jgi:hypothetical protein
MKELFTLPENNGCGEIDIYQFEVLRVFCKQYQHRVHTESTLCSDLSKPVPSTCRFVHREDYILQYAFVFVLSSSRKMLEYITTDFFHIHPNA